MKYNLKIYELYSKAMEFKKATEHVYETVYVVVERAEIIAVFSSYHDAVHYTNNLHPRKFNIKTVDFNPRTPRRFPDYIS